MAGSHTGFSAPVSMAIRSAGVAAALLGFGSSQHGRPCGTPGTWTGRGGAVARHAFPPSSSHDQMRKQHTATPMIGSHTFRDFCELGVAVHSSRI